MQVKKNNSNTDELFSENWDLVIRPKHSLFNIPLKELWNYRDLLLMFVKRDVVSQYKQTILGPLWFFIQPLLTTLTFIIIFTRIAKIPTDGIPPILFYMAGITCWNYFSDCLLKTSTIFVDNAQLFGKAYFPRLIMPFSIVVSNLIKFLIQLLLLAGIMVIYWAKGYDFHLNGFIILFFPLLILIMAGLGLGMGIIISSLTNKYRDLRHLISFGVQLLMYLTPVAYSMSGVPAKYKTLVFLNPMSSIIESFRFFLLGRGTFNLSDILYSFCCMLIILFLGIIIFNRVEKNFMDTV